MPKLAISPDVMRPLTPWLHGDWYVKRFQHYEGEVILPAQVFVCLSVAFELHEAPQTPLKTLEQSWSDTKKYLSSACQLISRETPMRSLSKEERKAILTTLGEPPDPAWPLYFFTVGEYPDEKIVYIGKTNSRSHRFSRGHAAITALHGPTYRGLRTRGYLASVTIYSDEGNYVPLDWLHPRALREAVWSDLEAQLIFHFQPELNRGLKRADRSKRPVFIALHNYSGTQSFDATPIDPHRSVHADEWNYLLLCGVRGNRLPAPP